MTHTHPPAAPMTRALTRVLRTLADAGSRADLLFLERWEREPEWGLAAARRVAQLRRANPLLAAEIRAELTRARGGGEG